MPDNENNIEKIMEEMDKDSEEFKLLQNIDDFIKSLKDFQLSQEQMEIIDGEITLFLLKQNTLSELRNNLEQHLGFSMGKEIRDTLIAKIYSFVNKNPKPGDETMLTKTKTSNTAAFTKINQSFTTPTTLAPTKRVYTEPTTTPSVTPTVGNKPLSEAIPVPPVNVDPYREAPDTR